MSRPAEIRISQEPGRPARLTVRDIEVEVPRDAEPADVGFAIVVDEARTARAPVQAVLLDEREVLEWRVLVHPDGSVTDDVGREPPRPRRPVRLVAGTVVVAVLLMAGVAAASGLPARAPSAAPSSAAAAPPSVAMEAIPAAPSSPAPTSAAQAPATPAPAPATAAPAAVAAPPPRTAAPVPVTAASRTAAAVPVPVRRTSAAAAPVRPAAPVVPAAPIARAAPVAPTTVPATAPAAPATTPAPATTTLSDAIGRCLTGGLTVAPCNGSAAQAWTGGAGRLRNAGRCLAYGNGVVLVDCAAPRTQGWVTSARTTTNAGLCLEALDGRAVLTQCGTGKALVLTSG